MTRVKTMSLLITLLVVLFTFSACGDDSQVTVEEKLPEASEGLDLKAVGDLAKESANAEDFEKKLNAPEGVNNLDLNNDKQVDYINVEETENPKGFKLVVKLENGEPQEIAQIEIKPINEQRATVNIYGNPNIYGEGHHHHSDFDLADYLLLSYILRPHPIYVSPFYYGHYPMGYVRYVPVPVTRYRTVVSRRVTTTKFQTSSPSSAPRPSTQSWKNATSVKAPVRNPTPQQRAFQERNMAKPVSKWGGGSSGSKSYGSSPSSSKPSPSTSRPSSPSRGTSGFGSRSGSSGGRRR